MSAPRPTGPPSEARPAHEGAPGFPGVRLLRSSLRGLLVAAAASAGVLSGTVGLLAPGPLRDRAVAGALDALDDAIAGRLDVERLDGPLGGQLVARRVRVVTPTGAPALSADHVSTRLRYLDLLASRVTLAGAEVVGLDLPLMDAAGAVPVAVAFAPVDPTPSPAPSAWSVALEAASIRGGVVSWAGDAPGQRTRRALTALTLTTSFHLAPAGLRWSHTLLTGRLGGRRLTVSTQGGLADRALTLDPLDATWGPHAVRAHVRLPDLAAGSVDIRLDGLTVGLRDALAVARAAPRPPPTGAGDLVTLAGTIQGRWAAPPGSLRAALTVRGGPVGALRVTAALGAGAGAGAEGPSLSVDVDAQDLDLSRLPAGLTAAPAGPPPALGATSLRAHLQGTGRPGEPGASWRAEATLAGLFGPAGALPSRVSVTGRVTGPLFAATVEAPGALQAGVQGDLDADYATATVHASDLDAGPVLRLVGHLARAGADGRGDGPAPSLLPGARGRLVSLDGTASLTGFTATAPLQLELSTWLSLADLAVPLPPGAAPGPAGAQVRVSAARGDLRGTWSWPGGRHPDAPGARAKGAMDGDLEADLEVVDARTPWGGAALLEVAASVAPLRAREAPRLVLRGSVTARGAWAGGSGATGAPVAAGRLALRGLRLTLRPGDWRAAGSAQLAAAGLRLAGGGHVGRVGGRLSATRRPEHLLGLNATIETDAAVFGAVSIPHLATRFEGTLSARGQIRGDVTAQALAPRAGAARWQRVDAQARLSPKGAGRLGVEGAVHALGMRVGAGPDVTARSTRARLSLVLGGRGLGLQGGGTWRVADAHSWGRAHPSLAGELSLDEGGAVTLTGRGGVLRELRASALLPSGRRRGFELGIEALRLEEARAGFLVAARRLRLSEAGGVELQGLRVEQLRGAGALAINARLPAGGGRLRVDVQATAARPGPWWARLRGLIGLPPTPRLPADGEFSGTIHVAGDRAALAGTVDLSLKRARVGGVTGLDGTVQASLTPPPGARARRRRSGRRRGGPVGRLTLNAELRQSGGGAIKLEDLSVPLAVSLQPPWVRLGDAFESAGRVVLDGVELAPLGIRVDRLTHRTPGRLQGADAPSQTDDAPQDHATARLLVGRVRGQVLMAPSPSRQLSIELEGLGLGVGSYTGRAATVLATLEPDRTSFGLALSWPGAPHGARRDEPEGGGPKPGSGPEESARAAVREPTDLSPAEDEARGSLEVRGAVDAGIEPVLRGEMTWAQLAEAFRGAGLGGAIKLEHVGLAALPWRVKVPASIAKVRLDGALTVQGTVEAPLVSGAVRAAGVQVGGGAWSADIQAQPERARPPVLFGSGGGASGVGELVNHVGVRVTGALDRGAARTIMEGSVRVPHILPVVFDDRSVAGALAASPALRVVGRLNPVPNALWVPWALGRGRARAALDVLDILAPGAALGGRVAVAGGAAGVRVTVSAHMERRRGARQAPAGGVTAGVPSDEALVGLARSVDVTARAGAEGLGVAVALDQLGGGTEGAPHGGTLALTVATRVPPEALFGEGAVDALRDATYAARLRADGFALDPLAQALPSVFGEARGALDGAVDVEATRAGWTGSGRLAARFERVAVTPLGLARRDLELGLALRPGSLELEPLVLEEDGRGGGRLELAARAALGEPAAWDAGKMPLSGRFTMDRFPLLGRKELAARLDGAMDIGGTLGRPRLLGRLAVARAQISPQLGGADLQPIELPQDVRFAAEGDEPGLRAAAPGEHVTASALVGRLPVDLDLELTLPKRRVRITHPFLDVRPWGKLHAVARGGPLRLDGRVWLDDGAVTLYEQRFVLTDQSYIDFTGNPDTDPVLHLAATYDISEVDLSAIGEETTEDSKITVRLDGTAADPGTPQLSSDPPMDESQIVSVIVLGSPVAGGAGGAASTERLSQVLLGALGLTSRLERELPFVDSLSLSAGTEALHLAVGKRVGAGLWFYYTLNLGAPEGENVHEGRMEYRFGKRLRLGTRFGDARKGSLDLLYRWRY